MLRNVKLSIRISLQIFVIFMPFSQVTAAALDLEVSGYATLLGSYTDSNDGIVYEHDYAHKYLNFTHQSRAGIQFNSKINENFDFSLTMLMEGSQNYVVTADWFYATYTANEDLYFRFGRLKVPFFMVSNYIDIGYAYPWVTPPQEVYSTNLISSADGIELVYDVTSSGGTNFLFELYFGSSVNEDTISPAIIKGSNPGNNELGDKILFEADNMIGYEALITTGSFTFRTGYYQALIEAKAFNIKDERTAIASVGIIIDWHNILLYSEFISRDSSDVADVIFADQKASYVTLGYRFGKFLPYVTAAKIDGGNNESIHSLRQTSTGVGFRYDINDSTDFKFEAIKVVPTEKLGDAGGALGLFDEAITGESANVYAMSLDILFD